MVHPIRFWHLEEIRENRGLETLEVDNLESVITPL